MSVRLIDLWTETVHRAPEAPALIDAGTDRTWTRRELDLAAREWSAIRGVELQGRTVVFAETNSAAWFQLFLGLLHANAVAVALDPGEPLVAQQATASAIRAAWLWTNQQLLPIPKPRSAAKDGRCFIKLTSGSTGVPRTIPFTDGQLIADGRQVCGSMDINPTDLNLGLIPFGHSYGLGNLVLPLLLQGTAVVCGVAAFPHAMGAAIAQWRPTVFPAVPAILRALTLAEISPGQLASLRTVISAGAPLPVEVAQAFREKFGKKIHSFYGSSETGGITFDRTGDAALTGRSVGTPMEGVTLQFARGGRFSVESAAVFTLGNRHRGAKGHGVHRPADLARLNDAGELVLIGRAGRFVKIAGRRLNLAEVEHALKRLPGVRDAYVVAHAERADALAAAVATNRATEELRSALRAQLASWKVPKKLLTLATFPITARGKTDTRRLREQLAGG
jgi:acyl-coenzyme A synthetase/AMP-(fatty) acid ligase